MSCSLRPNQAERSRLSLTQHCRAKYVDARFDRIEAEQISLRRLQTTLLVTVIASPLGATISLLAGA